MFGGDEDGVCAVEVLSDVVGVVIFFGFIDDEEEFFSGFSDPLCDVVVVFEWWLGAVGDEQDELGVLCGLLSDVIGFVSEFLLSFRVVVIVLFLRLRCWVPAWVPAGGVSEGEGVMVGCGVELAPIRGCSWCVAVDVLDFGFGEPIEQGCFADVFSSDDEDERFSFLWCWCWCWHDGALVLLSGLVVWWWLFGVILAGV